MVEPKGRIHSRLLVTLIYISACVGIQTDIHADNYRVASSDEIRVECRLDRSSYTFGQMINAEVMVINLTADTLRVVSLTGLPQPRFIIDGHFDLTSSYLWVDRNGWELMRLLPKDTACAVMPLYPFYWLLNPNDRSEAKRLRYIVGSHTAQVVLGVRDFSNRFSYTVDYPADESVRKELAELTAVTELFWSKVRHEPEVAARIEQFRSTLETSTYREVSDFLQIAVADIRNDSTKFLNYMSAFIEAYPGSPLVHGFLASAIRLFGRERIKLFIEQDISAGIGRSRAKAHFKYVDPENRVIYE